MSKSESEKFVAASQDKPISIVAEFILFVRENKKWWLLPILAVLGLAGIVVMLGSTGAAPFIYTLF